VVAPVIGVVCYRLAPGRVAGWTGDAYALPARYVDAVRRAGGRPVLVPSPDDASAVADVDGLLLAGGGDVEPRRFGASPHPMLYGLDPDRDELELGLVRLAVEREVPMLAICRGAQVANVALGGTLHQHLPDLPHLEQHGVPGASAGTVATHEVKLAEGSRTAQACGRAVVSVASSHHQGLDRLGEGLTAVAWTGDGLVEAVEHERGWLVAVQWHPELTAAEDPSQQALFEAFVRRAEAGC
jgi:gamma-glutamyl-gamma-aminobutyrate hydrolase PuuD